jgi:hypothetical protein
VFLLQGITWHSIVEMRGMPNGCTLTVCKFGPPKRSSKKYAGCQSEISPSIYNAHSQLPFSLTVSTAAARLQAEI